jgi:hypothetical protein
MVQVSTPGQSGYDRDTLSSEEQQSLQTTLDRAFEDIRTDEHNPVQNLLMQYNDEIEFAAEVAKAQFDQRFDGLNPGSGFFGIDTIHSGYFGYYDWDNTPDASSVGEVVDWIDDSAPDEFSGSGGRNNPIRVGENAVHLITGLGSYSQSPVATRHQFFKNDNPRTSFSSDVEFRNTDLRIKPFDAPVVLAEDDDLYARYLAGATGSEQLYLFGVSYIPEKQLRTIDPVDMPGENIVETP